ncbi:MAG: spoIIIE, partial [Verrucomicrobiaceae bacterium]|nr:spoIIIE [Verrucomicrobiaceae bacterium]
MLGLAIFFLLALFSYDPHDLPSWAMGNPTDMQNDPPANFIGRTGAFGAFVSLMAVGIASYLVPFSLTWFGVCRVASGQVTTMRHWLGMVMIVITGAALVDVWTGELSHQDVSPFGSGGAIGRLIGGRVFSNLFGHAGSLMVLGSIYSVGLIFVTGMHPIAVMRAARREIPLMISAMIKSWREKPVPVPEQAATPLEDPAETRRRSRAKLPTPSAIGASTATEPPSPETFTAQDLPLTFEPKIIDSSSPKPLLKDDNRPSLSDVWTKKRAQKIEQSGPAPMGSLTDRYRDYTLPTLDLLQWPDPSLVAPADPLELMEMQETIVRTLDSFGIKVTKGDITRGPAITRYEVRPVDGLRVSRIATLDADLARATKA